MKKTRFGALLAAGLLTLTFAGTALAGTVQWAGNGYPVNENCDDSAPGEALWIYTGDSDDAVVLTMNGIDYVGEQKGEGAWQIVTPYPESEPTASVVYTGSYDPGVLTLSHGCPPVTTTTTDVVTTTTTDVVTTTTDVVTTTTDVVTTTTDVVTTTTDVITTTTPDGSVEELTPPQTDALAAPTSSSTVSTGLLLVLASILAAALVVIPAAARSRR